MNCRVCIGNYPQDKVTYLFYGISKGKEEHVLLHKTDCADELDFVVCPECMRQLSEIYKEEQSKC